MQEAVDAPTKNEGSIGGNGGSHRYHRNNHDDILADQRPIVNVDVDNIPVDSVRGDDNDNSVAVVPVLISGNERRSSSDPTEGGTTPIVNQHATPNHLTEAHADPVSNRTSSAPVVPHNTSMEHPYDHHFYDNTPSNSQDGGEMYYPYPPGHETPSHQPWMLASPPVLPPNPYYPHHQQQIDHAVAYANAAAHVAWAAAQAVQQVVLHQQTTLPPQYPLPPPQMLLGAPPPFAPPPPPWIGHHIPTISPPLSYASPQGIAIPQYYNTNVVPPPFCHSGDAQLMVKAGMAPHLSVDHNDQNQINHHLNDESASVRSLPESVEQSRAYRQDDGHGSGRLGWYPRKRQQRLSSTESNCNQEPFMSPPQTRDKIRRRLRSSDNESSSSGSYYHHFKQNWNDCSNKGSYQNKTNYRNGGGRGHSSHSMNKKARSTNNEALIGKTGVAALFEWCSKRHCTPTFTIQKLVQTAPTTLLDDEFECIVFLEQPTSTSAVQDKKSTEVVDKPAAVDDSNCEDGFLHEWGRGYGRNKNAAKQDSARRAMHALIPGVQFDEETGILVALPSLTATTNATNFLDDLAPNLAMRLEISCDDPPDRSDTIQSSDSISGAMIKHKPVTHQKRTLGTYPETSTTSEDEDRSTYYASRGASVCSVLLHTIIQIDKKRIPDMPTFSYELSTTVSAGSACPPKEANAGNVFQCVENAATKQKVARCSSGSFKCTAKLKILSTSTGNDEIGEKKDDVGTKEPWHNVDENVIEAVGMGGTKRDARHVASAKLLSLLFPECNNDMAKVKAAAELMRDRYATSRVHKHHNQMSTRNRRINVGEKNDADAETRIDQANSNCSTRTNISFALSKPNDPPLPSHIRDFFGDLCNIPASIEHESSDPNSGDVFDGETNSCSVTTNCNYVVDLSAASVFRQLGRQKQMDYIVDSALQRFNELDDDGRLICGGGNEDDVGRTILRRAEPSDLTRIRKLMQIKKHEQQVFENTNRDSFSRRNSGDTQKTRPKHQVSDLSSTLADVTINGEISNQSIRQFHVKKSTAVSQLWSSTSAIVLLLCRAISAYEDPPLGCVYLSFDFSFAKGKVLRVIEIGSESHLPQERFLDCLQSFAACMHSTFERSRCTNEVVNRRHYTSHDLKSIVKSFTKRRRGVDSSTMDPSNVAGSVEIGTGLKRFQALRPVQEESEGSDDDDSKSTGSQRTEQSQPTNKAPGSVKPSKRSRFQ